MEQTGIRPYGTDDGASIWLWWTHWVGDLQELSEQPVADDADKSKKKFQSEKFYFIFIHFVV